MQCIGRSCICRYARRSSAALELMQRILRTGRKQKGMPKHPFQHPCRLALRLLTVVRFGALSRLLRFLGSRLRRLVECWRYRLVLACIVGRRLLGNQSGRLWLHCGLLLGRHRLYRLLGLSVCCLLSDGLLRLRVHDRLAGDDLRARQRLLRCGLGFGFSCSLARRSASR